MESNKRSSTDKSIEPSSKKSKGKHNVDDVKESESDGISEDERERRRLVKSDNRRFGYAWYCLRDKEAGSACLNFMKDIYFRVSKIASLKSMKSMHDARSHAMAAMKFTEEACGNLDEILSRVFERHKINRKAPKLECKTVLIPSMSPKYKNFLVGKSDVTRHNLVDTHDAENEIEKLLEMFIEMLDEEEKNILEKSKVHDVIDNLTEAKKAIVRYKNYILNNQITKHK